ncbi:MAG TPA: hypothetical protein VK936_01785 [Longimicrobiales bacterium]|nr:hypothetical protein [Longimicrobiales bacterium]
MRHRIAPPHPPAGLCAVVLVLLLPGPGLAQAGGGDEALIRNALSAAPPAVAANAAVVSDGRVLREGTNGWTCMPSTAEPPNNAPMCLDAAWLAFFDSYMNRSEPAFGGIGVAYMLQGDAPVSNTDPFATAPTDDNEWLDDSGPHIMLIVQDRRLLDSLPTDPHSGGPYVMWRGTPYAHIMIPTVPRRDH